MYDLTIYGQYAKGQQLEKIGPTFFKFNSCAEVPKIKHFPQPRVVFALLETSASRQLLVSHDVTKIQTKKLSILPRFYFHDALE